MIVVRSGFADVDPAEDALDGVLVGIAGLSGLLDATESFAERAGFFGVPRVVALFEVSSSNFSCTSAI